MGTQEYHPHIQQLLKCIALEEKEEINRYKLDKQHTLRTLKAAGLALHPIRIHKKGFGFADYPEFSFSISFPQEHQFKDSCAIECFAEGEEPIKGILISFDGKQGECRLFAPDFPDWLEDKNTGIKRIPDHRTNMAMKDGLLQLYKHPTLLALFSSIHTANRTRKPIALKPSTFIEKDILNESQQTAVQAIVNNEQLCIVHGPPGTGKTTTLLEAIHTLVQQGEKIVVAAPSNTAVDHIAQGLITKKINILRIGNTSKVNEIIYPHTIEGKMADAAQRKEIKQLKIRAEEFRKMALRYKRSFGKAEREQRSLLFKEVKTIRDDIKKLVAYQEEKLVTDANVILGTPIGLQSAPFKMNSFDTLFLDEAGQCLEPLAWCIFPFAKRYVLAGDHLQLPPTVLSDEANRLGFSTSILEACIPSIAEVYLLDTQYRMRKAIAGFSSDYFYNSLLQTPAHLQNISQHIHFYDTAGMGYEEQHGSDGTSLQNEGELLLASKIMELEKWVMHESAFISPYAAQVALAKNHFPSSMRVSTIDSFQGQEKKNILLSLVRSNDQCQIGFLQDYRRMNVALTRAKETLIVIGDSATLGKHPFYQQFLSYVEKHGVYTSGWEFIE